METVYVICAVAGGTVLVIQFVLLAFGGHIGSGDVDADADVSGGDFHHDFGGGSGDAGHDAAGHDASDQQTDHADAQQAAFLKFLSFKTVVSFLTFFGLGGLACDQAGFGGLPTLLMAVGAGSVALFLVAYLMSALIRLQSKGNVNLSNATGQTGHVYLRVPGQNSGAGKVNVVVQARLVECKAMTSGPEIPTGSEVRVVGVRGTDTLEVVPVKKE